MLLGWGPMSGGGDLVAADNKPIPGTWLLNGKGEWEEAMQPLNRYSNLIPAGQKQKFHLGEAFVARLRELGITEEIGLIVNARDDAHIDNWLKQHAFYEQSLRRVADLPNKSSISQVLFQPRQSQGRRVPLVGVALEDPAIPAEEKARLQELANQLILTEPYDPKYGCKVAAIVRNMRHDLEQVQLPFVVGQVIPSAGDVVSVNSQIIQLPRWNSNLATVSLEGLTMDEQGRLDREGINTLGKRYADAYVHLQKKITAGPTNPPASPATAGQPSRPQPGVTAVPLLPQGGYPVSVRRSRRHVIDFRPAPTIRGGRPTPNYPSPTKD